jgi:hypothetical protein
MRHDVWSFRGADSHTDHCLVVEEFRKRLSVSKWETQKFDIHRFDLKKLNKVEIMEKFTLKPQTGV